MPLREGKSKGTIGANIEELVASGHSREQAIAIALDKAGIDRAFGDGDKRSRRAPARPSWGIMG